MKPVTTFLAVCLSLAFAVAPARPTRAAGAAHRHSAQPPAAPIELALDATEAPRRVLHARLTIPAQPGPLTLYYPKWIPGEHGPTGPIRDLAALKFRAGGKPLAWRRDDEDLYAFH